MLKEQCTDNLKDFKYFIGVVTIKHGYAMNGDKIPKVSVINCVKYNGAFDIIIYCKTQPSMSDAVFFSYGLN